MSADLPSELFTAIGIFKGNDNWRVDVAVPNFPTQEEAQAYAQVFQIKLINGKLYRDDGKETGLFDDTSREVLDSQVTVSRRTNAPGAVDGYEKVDLPIAQWQAEPGLANGLTHDFWQTQADQI